MHLKHTLGLNLMLALPVDTHIIVLGQSVLNALAILMPTKGHKLGASMSKGALSKAMQFRRMVAQIAIGMWKMLPRQHQIWISVDDLVEDGMFRAYQIASGKWHDESKAKLSTAIYHAVHNHLLNEYIVKYTNEQRYATLESAGIVDYDMKHKRRLESKKKRNTPTSVVYIDEPVITGEGERVMELPQLSTSEDTIYRNVLSDCFVIPVLGKIYNEASSKLQDEMVVWFIQNKDKVHLKSSKFKRRAREFRMLSREYNLTYDDCLHIFQSPQCMNRLSHQLLGLPFNLDHPTPIFDKEL